jgi:hypothetical protein
VASPKKLSSPPTRPRKSGKAASRASRGKKPVQSRSREKKAASEKPKKKPKKAQKPLQPKKRKAPVTPKRKAPVTPKRKAPRAPKRKAPATPTRKAPVAPKRKAPAAPKRKAPAAPKRKKPSAPKRKAGRPIRLGSGARVSFREIDGRPGTIGADEFRLSLPDGSPLSWERFPSVLSAFDETAKLEFLEGRVRAEIHSRERRKRETRFKREAKKIAKSTEDLILLLEQKSEDLQREQFRSRSPGRSFQERKKHEGRAAALTQEIALINQEIGDSLVPLQNFLKKSLTTETIRKNLLSYETPGVAQTPRQRIQVETEIARIEPVAVTQKTMFHVLQSFYPLMERIWNLADRRVRKKLGRRAPFIFRFLYAEKIQGKMIEQGFGLSRLKYDSFDLLWEQLMKKLEGPTGFLSKDPSRNYFMTGKVAPRVYLTGFTIEHEMKRGRSIKGEARKRAEAEFRLEMIPQHLKGMQTSLKLMGERMKRDFYPDPNRTLKLMDAKVDRLVRERDRLEAYLRKKKKRKKT